MERALWLLLWLRLFGWGRRLGLNLKTVKGILLAIIGGGILLLWIASLVISRVITGQPQRVVDLAVIRLYGPLVLLGYCVLSSAFSAGERSVTFNPAEVNFLFSGPFTRRKLLLYKIVGTLLTSLLTSVFLTLVLAQYGTSLLTAFAGILLAMVFMQLFAMASAMLAAWVGAKAYTRRRRVALVLLLVVLGAALLHATRAAGVTNVGELFRTLAEAPLVQALLTPLGWFVDAFTAEQVWPDLVVSVFLSVLVDLALLAIVLGLDARYLESAAAASEKTYARLQRLRTGGGAAAWGALSGKARFSLPSLPWWGGAGPIAWRQMVTASRGLKGLIVFLVFLGAMMIWPFFLGARGNMDVHELPRILGGMLLALSLFTLPMMLTFDFRGDVDRMDVLKSLPVPAWRLAVGQLLTPMLLTTVIQLVFLGILQAAGGGMELFLIGAVAFALPVNFLLFGVENLIFLWFPTRMMAATPGDFQVMGRYMLLYIAKFFVLGLTLGTAFLVGAVVYFIVDDYYVAGAACLPVVVGAGCALVPLIAHAFRRFDVARDTPA